MLKFLGKLLVVLCLNGLALAILGWVGYDAYERGVFENGGLRPVVAAVEPVKASTTRVDMRNVLNANLFGRAKQKVTKKVVVAPPTRLNLKLVGIMARTPESSSLALIEISRGKQQVVRIGQTIGKSGATLNQVLTNHVLIERNGKLEKLAIKRSALDSETNTGKKQKNSASNLTAQIAAPTAPSVSSLRKVIDDEEELEDGEERIVLPF